MSQHDTHGGPVLETEQLEGLLMAAGPDGLNDILDAFWRSTNDLLSQLNGQIQSGDFAEAARTAHAIKGSASNVGANLLANIAKEMENACREGDAASLQSSADQSTDAVELTKQAVADMIARAA